MKSIIRLSAIFIIVLLNSGVKITQAQNYEAVKTDASYYFIDSASLEIIVARIDSVASSGSETNYWAMRQIRETDYSCFIPSGASWLGDIVTEKPNGVFQFTLYPFSPPDSSDIFTIQSQKPIGGSWHFYNYHTINHFIEASVTQINETYFLGITDSVKTISLQRKDSSGQNIEDPINTQHILLSKNYGLIRLPKFDEFNTNLKFLDLCGKTNPVTGTANLTFEEIFDFQPGDEFHLVYDDTPYAFWYPKETGFVIQHILERTNSSNSDTISYKVSECKTASFTEGMGQYTITNSLDTVIVHYIKSDYPAFVFDPKEPQMSTGMELELTESHSGLSSTNVLEQSGVLWKLTNATWPLWSDESQQCWHYAIIDNFENSAYFYKGLGGPYHYHMGIITTNYNKLVFYKKGSETWGTALNCDSLLHVRLGEYPQNKTITIYPNPTNSRITVSVPAGVHFPCKFELFNPAGWKSAEFTLNQQTESFNLSALIPGLYFSRLTTATGELIMSKIIRQ
jgi:hypothetical protein